MGLRYRKSIKIAPGVRLNVNKKSVGVTVGGKGLHYTVNSKGQTTKTVGIPGTGLSYSKTSGRERATAPRQTADADIVPQAPAEKKRKPPKVRADIRFCDPADRGNIVLGVLLLVAAFFISGFSWPLAIVVALLAGWFFLSYVRYKKHPDDPKYITPEQLDRWRGLLGVSSGSAHELGKKSVPVLVDLKEQVYQAVQAMDGPAVLELQGKIVAFSEFVVIRGDNPAEDFDRYVTAFKEFEA